MNLRNFFLMTVVAGAAFAQQLPQPTFDRASLDTNCKPCDDFWRYANGGWLDKNPIPARYPSWGTMNVMREANRERLKTILEAAASDTCRRAVQYTRCRSGAAP